VAKKLLKMQICDAVNTRLSSQIKIPNGFWVADPLPSVGSREGSVLLQSPYEGAALKSTLQPRTEVPESHKEHGPGLKNVPRPS
jgi:hypothetical protein